MGLRCYTVDAVGAAAHGATDYATDSGEYAGTATAAGSTVATVAIVPRGERDSEKGLKNVHINFIKTM